MITSRQFDIDLQDTIRAGAKLLCRSFDLFGVWASGGFKRLHVLCGRRQTVDRSVLARFCFQIDDANGVVVRVCDVELVVGQRQAAGFVKRR